MNGLVVHIERATRTANSAPPPPPLPLPPPLSPPPLPQLALNSTHRLGVTREVGTRQLHKRSTAKVRAL